MRLEEIYNYENAGELKNDLELEFFSSLVWSKHSRSKDERIAEFKSLEKKLKYYYSKYKTGLTTKVENKKYLEKIFYELNQEEVKITHKNLLKEIPEF